MRKITFNLPVEAMLEFATELEERELINTIIGVSENDEIIVEVEYDREQSSDVDELEELVDSYIEEDSLEDDE